MITTLTLNPAIDKTLMIENFSINQVNRIFSERLDAGGKGINVSKIANFLGENTMSLGVVGGKTGDIFLDLLNKAKIPHDFIKISENIRTNTKIVDPINNTCTDINEAGPSLTKENLEEIEAKIQEYSKKSKYLILSGNVQNGVFENFYEEIIRKTHCLDVKVFLDTGGTQLKNGIKANPWFIKPNVDELRELTGNALETKEDIIACGKELVKNGINYVCISLGEKGLLLVSENEALYAKPPKVVPKSTVGAGDSVVGSMAVSFSRGENTEDALKKACALSAACVTLESTAIPEKVLVNKLYENVVLIKL